MYHLKTSLIILSCMFIFSCQSLKNTKHLKKGMTEENVIAVLGPPKMVEMQRDYVIYNYSLHGYGMGFVPYILVFDVNGELIHWTADMDSYYRNQELWINAFEENSHDNEINIQVHNKNSY